MRETRDLRPTHFRCFSHVREDRSRGIHGDRRSKRDQSFVKVSPTTRLSFTVYICEPSQIISAINVSTLVPYPNPRPPSRGGDRTPTSLVRDLGLCRLTLDCP